MISATLIAAVVAWFQLAPGLDGGEPSVTVIASYPHDPTAYTQGLTIHEGELYEGTGQFGRSSIRRVNLVTGDIERIKPLDSELFGEGITVLGDRLYQLTWKNGLAFVYELETFRLLKTFRVDGEGWGLTHDGRHLILSDGSSELDILDPETFQVLRTVAVRDEGRPVERLNELEFVRGEIWANIWFDERIARISPETGEVLGWVDLSELYPRSRRTYEEVLNGIAFDPQSERLFVTGKNWPALFEIRVR